MSVIFLVCVVLASAIFGGIVVYVLCVAWAYRAMDEADNRRIERMKRLRVVK